MKLPSSLLTAIGFVVTISALNIGVVAYQAHEAGVSIPITLALELEQLQSEMKETGSFFQK